MIEHIQPSVVDGVCKAPASKSHTIRALLIASLAEGVSRIDHPLESDDARSCIDACRALGAEITRTDSDALLVAGTGGPPYASGQPIDVGNSGTTLYLAMGIAATATGLTEFTGDEQIRRRSAANLLAALTDLGARAYSRGENGCAPLTVGGGIAGGTTAIECPTSQYLSSLLLACPLAAGDCTIEVPLLWERPYVDMTLWWLDRQQIEYRREGYERFFVPGNQSYRPFRTDVPGDYSSATFLFVAAAVTGGTVTVRELHDDDPQGDAAVLDMLESMGCTVNRPRPRTIRLESPGYGSLKGGSFDLNATPDALPALAVAGAACREPLHLANVPQAREKETDRVAVMAQELGKLGIRTDEYRDGITVYPGAISGGRVSGHGDHRVVMALALAGLAAADEISIEGAEAAAITFPSFFDTLRSLCR